MGSIKHNGKWLGVDVGSVAVSLALIGNNDNTIETAYRFHKGDIHGTIRSMSEGLDLAGLSGIGVVTSPGIFRKEIPCFDSLTSIIKASKYLCGKPGAVLYVGAQRFHLINFDEEGNYMNTVTNTSCAAGTGSFLEQQSGRLKLSGVEELCSIAGSNKDEIPEIASRCSVFAKTDLIHAQQAGYSLAAICDSLCCGLARNISDTLFTDRNVNRPVIFAGGVSLNSAVRAYIEKHTGIEFQIPESSNTFGAIGAALQAREENRVTGFKGRELASYLLEEKKERDYYHSPLRIEMSRYPDFEDGQHENFTTSVPGHHTPVRIDIYTPLPVQSVTDVYIGIDIGSTSTKAVITNPEGKPFTGFYTYTNGQPFFATQSLLEAIDYISGKSATQLNFLGCGTTGSGRKFIGKIIGADLVIDEITAHARAAYELNPETDTIIEIGGQDSKFTLIRDGRVVFSEMNSVCAAGTGSFIEELAGRLGVPLEAYSNRAENASAPLASDRCTVFMERDINNYLNSGYSVDECLASVLHSVRENYLKKVATEASIGKNVCFQGATAKNRALVAAFEKRLNREIYVSRYCHLTGALGVALQAAGDKIINSEFRGLQLYKESIPFETEICQLCNNRCKIRIATISGEKVAYGFLCGRDYETKKYVNSNSSGFDLLGARKKLFSSSAAPSVKDAPVMGIPYALHLVEEISLWQSFFHRTGFRTVTSRGVKDTLKEGKHLSGAEFCAPIDNLFGHVDWLADRCDHIFMPVYLEAAGKEDSRDRLYCYYTQWSSSVASLMKQKSIDKKSIVPLLNSGLPSSNTPDDLYPYLKDLLPGLSLLKIREAWNLSLSEYRQKRQKLKELFIEKVNSRGKISVVLLGRPYLVLDPVMNKGIPAQFEKMGYKTFYQDMIPISSGEVEEIDYLLRVFPWYFAARILEAAGAIAGMKNVYPVYISAFKCAPDSFAIEYFKKILEKHRKPYLLLQIDEHDSNVGYETRIEAAIRSFENHASAEISPDPLKTAVITPPIMKLDRDKTLLFPNWDPLTSPLLVANLRRSGVNARLLESSELNIRKGMSHNTGQCLPLNIITQDYIDYVERNSLDPAETMLWMTETRLSCNIRMYPYYIKTILDGYGRGFEKSLVYSGDLTHLDISINTTYHAYFAYMFGGLLRRLACSKRPYEKVIGTTDNITSESLELLEKAFSGDYSIEKAAIEVNEKFAGIEVTGEKRPKVAIFGDFYVRDNDLMNQDLIEKIEESGGEVINTPYNDYTKLAAENALRRRMASGRNLEAIGFRAFLSGLKMLEKRYYKPFEKLLGPSYDFNVGKIEKKLSQFNIKPYHSGESYDNMLKIFYLLEKYPDVALFVQTNPGFCCPSLITEAMRSDIQRITNVPIVTITYDGTSDSKNDIVIPYIRLINQTAGTDQEVCSVDHDLAHRKIFLD